MGFSFMDFMEMAAPIGVAMIPGVGIPASIALSAAMKGGGTALKGGGLPEVLRDAAIGAGTGAAGAGTAGAISKFAGKAGGAAVEQGGKKATEIFAEGGPDMFSDAMEALAKAGGRQKVAQGVSGAFSGALGDDPEKTAKLLDTVKQGGQVAGAADQAFQFMNQPPTFSQQHAALAGRHPGMNPTYQFGGGFGRGGTPTLGFMGGY